MHKNKGIFAKLFCFAVAGVIAGFSFGGKVEAATPAEQAAKIAALRMNNGHYVEVTPDVELFYIDKGKGTPLIFVPGWSFSADAFLHQIEHFSQKYRVIAVDPRSQGDSTKTSLGNDYPTHGKDLAALINKLKLKNVVLAGWSFGNFDTWEYVQQNGLNNVKAVIMIDNKPKTITDGKVGGLGKQVTGYLKSQADYRGFITAFANKKLLTRPVASVEEFNVLAGKSLQVPYNAARDEYISGWFGDREDTVKEISKKRPSIMIFSADRVEPTSTWLKANAPKTEIRSLGKHMMFWEFPKQFNGFIDEFMQKNNIE